MIPPNIRALICTALAAACALLTATYSSLALPEAGVFPLNNDGTAKAKTDQYEAWLGKDIKHIIQGYDGSNWNYIDGTSTAGLSYWTGQWMNYPQEYKDRIVLAVPILPSYDGNKDGQPDDGSTLATGATGAYNQRWVNAANKLVSRGFGNCTLRLGWEFNGGWYTWNAKGGRQAHFKNYWIQIVNSMRSVPGANFKFCWNPTAGDMGMGDPMAAFPGAAYVDFIGIDLYDITQGTGYYGTPGYPNLPAWQVDAIRREAWNSHAHWSGGYRLDWWAAQASAVGVPLCFPEWGLDSPQNPSASNGYGGKDNPYFIRQFHKWVTNPVNNVAWHAYFDWGTGTSVRNHSIFFSEQYPLSKAIFPGLFGLRMGDGFDNGLTQWTTAQPTQWSVISDGGDNALRFDFDWAAQAGAVYGGDAAWTNYRVSTDFKCEYIWGWAEVHLYGRYIDGNNWYRVSIQDQGGPVKALLQKRVAGTTTTLGSVTVPVVANTWYNLELELDGGKLTVFHNGTAVLTRTDTTHTAGKIGLGVWKQDVRFDAVTVY